MQIMFSGAAHEVTGSCTLITANGKNILVDCGMEQGADVFENAEISVNPGRIDAVLLTHAHIDHSGKLPLLYRNGFKGDIFATDATTDLCDIMLKDSAHIQEFEAQWRNRKGRRAGEKEYQPLYTMDDAMQTLSHFRPQKYNTQVKVCDGISIEFFDAGHLLGSSSIRITVLENGKKTVLAFSGDIGNTNKPLLRDPQYIDSADYVFMESTYGDRLHEQMPDYVKNLTEVINDTFARGGNLVIPSFAIGRTQELLYFIRKIKHDKLADKNFKVYVDSPLAIEATRVFRENYLSCYDEETVELLRAGINPLMFDGLITTVTADESKAINLDEDPKIIISASGMCEAGRIRHHLKHNLWREESTVLFVGYQGANTLGRALLDGAKTVKLFGETIAVNAKIASLAGISGHADRAGLLRWINAYSPRPKHVFVMHGDETVCDSFAKSLSAEGFNATAPYSGEIWSLDDNRMIAAGDKKRVQGAKKPRTDTNAADRAMERLRAAIAAGDDRRLTLIIDGINNLLNNLNK